MNRRDFLRSILAASAISSSFIRSVIGGEANSTVRLLNPYADVDWGKFGHHMAAMHIHTLQSDGRQMVAEVVEGYRRAGFSIMAITDHDCFAPNVHVPKEVPKDKASPYPKGAKPAGYPANPTWPWSDYGCKSPETLGMVGIQANELTFRHHINSYFNDYGIWYKRKGNAPYGGIVDGNGKEIWEDDQIAGVAQKGGLAILNHPGLSDDKSWWVRQPLSWYIERFEKHPADCLVGIEVTNNGSSTETYDEGLWDQLLGRFMPQRPVWGFGNDDMHLLNSTKQAFNLFYLSDCTPENVRAAMEKGQFCACKSTRHINYQSEDVKIDQFPVIDSINIDQQAGTITIEAHECDQIRWITCPKSATPIADYKTSDQPWNPGQVVGTEKTLNFRKSGIRRYVRAELIRNDGEHTQKLFTNPFGIVNS